MLRMDRFKGAQDVASQRPSNFGSRGLEGCDADGARYRVDADVVGQCGGGGVVVAGEHRDVVAVATKSPPAAVMTASATSVELRYVKPPAATLAMAAHRMTVG